MSRKLPPFVRDHYYHIYNRGAHKQAIFREDDNYVYVLRKVKNYCRDFMLTIIAYCLMPNHYHFLVHQDGEYPAGKLPQRVFNSYSKAYNKRYDHSGTLFEGPYDARIIDKESYLLHLCRYIHVNPVKDGLVERPQEWQYSNYLEWTGRRAGTLVDKSFIADHFESVAAYEEFVFEYVKYRKLPDALSYLDEL